MTDRGVSNARRPPTAARVHHNKNGDTLSVAALEVSPIRTAPRLLFRPHVYHAQILHVGLENAGVDGITDAAQ